MLKVNDRHNPSFILLPVNNNRTAWRPFGLPVVMVVPHRRNISGGTIQNSNIFNVKIYIENVPREARIAGHDNIGERFPDRELYAEYLNSLELAEKFIDLNDYQFYDKNGNEINKLDAVNGSTFKFTSVTGVTDNIEYYQDADYYDLSDVLIDVELLPIDRYKLVYETEYFARVISQDELQEFLCIDTSHIATARFKFEINHPGEIINEFYKLTPPQYLTNASKSNDSTVALYRPYTDLLQDIYDEQALLEKINWVFDTPPEAIPYISALLGWELPYFPESLDTLRKAVLRRTVEFQNLAGSRRAIINVFRLFGFEILISNLWWSSDGKRFIRPGEQLPESYKNQEIQIENICQTDLIFNGYTQSGFVEKTVPLLFRPQLKTTFGDFSAIRDGGDITVEAYLVTKNSEAHTKLQELSNQISDNPEWFGSVDGCFIDNNGFIASKTINDAMNGISIDGFSQIQISGKLGLPSNELLIGNAPLSKKTLKFNRETNNLTLTINGYFDSTTQVIYIFANYERQQIRVPSIIQDLQSNRFDIQVLTQSFEEFADPTTLEFAIEFLNRLKAFHSLLNLIRTRIELTETYEVTDWCVGGDNVMRYDTDAGMLQVPPAIIPNIPGAINDCTLLDPKNLGYKDSDLLLRIRKLTNLPEEHEAWKILDNRSDELTDGLQLRPMQSGLGRTKCKYTYNGQDKITGTRIESRDTQYGPGPNASKQIAGNPENPKASPSDIADNGFFDETGGIVSTNSNSGAYSSFNREFTEIRDPVCDTSNVDFCYKGRLDDELLFRNSITIIDNPRIKACSIGVGSGVYYTFPSKSQVAIPGTKNPKNPKYTGKIQFTGNAQEHGQNFFNSGVQKHYLSADYNKPLDNLQNSHLGHLYRSYGIPVTETLHYHNRRGMPDLDQRYNLALQRPSLGIDKPTMHLPGCNFLFMNALEEDFEHDIWEARPWDDQYSTYCGPKNICETSEPNFLNAEIVKDENGNETLVFDYAPFRIQGNGLIPILINYGGDKNPSNNIIHSVYMPNCEDNPFVILDSVDELADTTSDLIIAVDDPLFNSHNACGSETIDFIDGYASDYGSFNVNKSDTDDFYEEWIDVFESLDLPKQLDFSNQVSCRYGSGIRDASVMTLRYDCGCLLAGCDGTEIGETICSSDIFLDSDGQYDWEPDHLLIESRLKLEERVGVCSNRMDGTIPSFLEVL